MSQINRPITVENCLVADINLKLRSLIEFDSRIYVPALPNYRYVPDFARHSGDKQNFHSNFSLAKLRLCVCCLIAATTQEMAKGDAMESPRRRRRHRVSSSQKSSKDTPVIEAEAQPSNEKITNEMTSQQAEGTSDRKSIELAQPQHAPPMAQAPVGSDERQSTSRGRGDRKSGRRERSGSRKKRQSGSKRRSESPRKRSTSRRRRPRATKAKEVPDDKKSRVDSLVDDLRKEYESPRQSRSPSKRRRSVGEKLASSNTTAEGFEVQAWEGDETARAVSPSHDRTDSGYETPPPTDTQPTSRNRSRSRSRREQRRSSGKNSTRSNSNSQNSHKRKKDPNRVSPGVAESPSKQGKRHVLSPKKLRTPRTPNTSRSYRGHRTIVPDIVAPPITTDGSYHKSYVDRPQREFIDKLDWKGFSPVAHSRKLLKVLDIPKPPTSSSSLSRSLHASAPNVVHTSESDDSSVIYKSDPILSKVRDWNKEYVPTKRQAHRKSTVEYHNQKLHMSMSTANMRGSSRSGEIAKLLESLGDEKKNARYLERAKQRHAHRRSSDPLKNDHRFSRSSDIVFSPVALAAATTATTATQLDPVPVL